MKTINFKNWITRLVLVLMSAVFSIQSFAQEKELDVNINTNQSGNWYTAPWVWVVGAAVFILLLAAILRGGGSRRTDA